MSHLRRPANGRFGATRARLTRVLGLPATHADSTVRAAMATMPEREQSARHVVERVSAQVDELYIYLNGYQDVPPWLLDTQAVHPVLGEDLGDRGKFAFLKGHSGYYVTLDDDILYPDYYVQHLVDGIERYRRRAVVGWHGAVLLGEAVTDYYDPASRQVYWYRRECREDAFVHVLGTGCMAFHTSTIGITLGNFPAPNVADLFFAVTAQEQSVPLVVLAHGAEEAVPIESESGVSIYQHSKQDLPTRFNVRAEANRILASRSTWLINRTDPVQR